MKDTEDWDYVTNVLEKGLGVVFAGSTTAWCWTGIMKELLVEW